MQKNFSVRAYTIRHGLNARDFIVAYQTLLQHAIDEIWQRTRWVEKPKLFGRRIEGVRYTATRLIPTLPKSGQFKHHTLRHKLMEGWSYAKHYVDSAIKQAYSILHSWRQSYLKGERSREKPVVKRRFVRIKETLCTFRDGKLRITLKPWKRYLELDLSRAWFWDRARGEMGEIILKDDSLTITFRDAAPPIEPAKRLAWDSNETWLDAFDPELSWIRVDLSELYHVHRTYELKRKRLRGACFEETIAAQNFAKILEAGEKPG